MKKTGTIHRLCLIGFAVMVINGCGQGPNSLSFPTSELRIVTFQGFDIPIFPTAQGQLNYAKSGFPSPEKRQAAFKILFHHFPEAKIECGHAALALAYMNLTDDYRFADKQDCIQAINAYHDVIETFKEHPQILVRAFWYLGWIHCDLLKDRETGIGYFWHIVNTYPDINMGISSPVPWVSLVTPLSIKEGQPDKDTSKKPWAGLALLEIIRHSRSSSERFDAFDILWKKYQNTIVTGLAIQLLLQDKEHAREVLPLVNQYLALNIANPHLAREIEARSKEY